MLIESPPGFLTVIDSSADKKDDYDLSCRMLNKSNLDTTATNTHPTNSKSSDIFEVFAIGLDMLLLVIIFLLFVTLTQKQYRVKTPDKSFILHS